MRYYKYILTGEVFSEKEYREIIGEGFDEDPLQKSLLFGSKEGYIDALLAMRGYGFILLQDGEVTGNYCVGFYRDEEEFFDVFFHTDDEEIAYDVCEEFNEIFEEEFKEEAEQSGAPFTVLTLRKW
ncbi:hypothetical protein IEO70_03910 [Bacillus sp. AGMB 02131]|uniref:Uncharacterized protein n=1 Tax=Peribacillus faecalis TaxID=2772559 RepID=A0A927CUV2_9BACI|nr:hypothetical protein [Peribacillus faecalis]MBD3107501.1 hypothetical protein [Peribacillus faecalis]